MLPITYIKLIGDGPQRWRDLMLHVTYVIIKVTCNVLKRPSRGKRRRASSSRVTQITKVTYNNNMSPLCTSLKFIFYIVYKSSTKVTCEGIDSNWDLYHSEEKTTLTRKKYNGRGYCPTRDLTLHTKKQDGIIFKIDFEKAYNKVRWDFLQQTLRIKGFSYVWCKWIEAFTEGGNVGIKVNDQIANTI